MSPHLRFLCAALAVALACRPAASQRHDSAAAPAPGEARVTVTGPTVIAWLVVPPGAVDTSEAMAVTADDWNYAMAWLRDSLAAHGIRLVDTSDSMVRIASPGVAELTLPLRDGGYILARPGDRLCALEGADADLAFASAVARFTPAARADSARAVPCTPVVAR